MPSQCVFCGTHKFQINKSLDLPAESSVIYEDKYVFITPDVAPLVDGHYLIISQEHIHSFGNASTDVYQALEKAKQYLIENIYHSEDVLFWEHGAVISNTGGASIDHAHMHAVPCSVRFDIDKILEEYPSIVAPKDRISYNALRNNAQTLKPYVSYALGRDAGFYRCVHNLPSQFFRFLVSKYTLQEYNWKLRYSDRESKKSFLRTLSMAHNDAEIHQSILNIGV